MLTPVRTGAGVAVRSESTAGARAASAELWLLAVIAIIGLALRFATIATQSYWVDEATTVHEVHLSFGAMLHAIRVNETTPPLYFALAWVWAKLFGTGELGLRSLSALLGVAIIPVAYLCGRELISRAAGIATAAIVAVNPFMIWYSQEARSYMLFALLSALSFLFFVRVRRTPTGRNIAWWGLFSALAVLTHFFAAFLIAPEAVWLLARVRNRAVLLSAAAVAVAQAAVIPLAVSDTTHPLQWIKAFPLSIRIKQIPVDFGLSALYQSSLVTHGLEGAAVLAAIVGVLVVIGAAGREQRRGAAVAAALAAFVILVPIVLAELGRDYVVARNFTPALVPLAVLLGAACAAPRMRPAGIALGVVLLVAFIWAGIRIDQNSQYQRPNWRGVAAALGHPAGSRAIVAYDGGFASLPLAVYLRGVPWTQNSQQPVTVGELDVVGSTWQTRAAALPPGVRLLSSRDVDEFRVERFSIRPTWHLAPAALGARAQSLLGPAPPNPAVLIQR